MIYNYVVIEREYGSGGTEVGGILSEKAGIPCYGKEILEDAARRLGIPVSQIEHYEENIHARPEIRKERAVKEYGIAQSDAENILEKYDKNVLISTPQMSGENGTIGIIIILYLTAAKSGYRNARI